MTVLIAASILSAGMAVLAGELRHHRTTRRRP